MGARSMQPLTAGITKAGTGLDGISWNILGQTYVPKQLSESSFAWHATFPPGTAVPPHIHPTQDEFIYMLEGRFDLLLDGHDYAATSGDLIRLPMNISHGIFNKTDQTVKCFFWLDVVLGMDKAEAERLAGRKDAVNISVNAFLLRLNGKWALVDAGSGNTMGPTLGKLSDNLRASGVPPDKIETIFLTHLHPDHSNGL